MFNVNEYLENPVNQVGDGIPYMVEKITCVDGLQLSVQASGVHYCSPRSNDGPWDSVEVGFPSRRIEKLMEYAEDVYSPTQTVYGYVPVEIVNEVINEAGGIVD